MNHKNLLTPASVTVLLTLALLFVFIQLWDTSLQNLMNEVFAIAIYGLLIVSYLLRIALVFFGVFAVYQVLKEHVNSQDSKRAEVQFGLK